MRPITSATIGVSPTLALLAEAAASTVLQSTPDLAATPLADASVPVPEQPEKKVDTTNPRDLSLLIGYVIQCSSVEERLKKVNELLAARENKIDLENLEEKVRTVAASVVDGDTKTFEQNFPEIIAELKKSLEAQSPPSETSSDKELIDHLRFQHLEEERVRLQRQRAQLMQAIAESNLNVSDRAIHMLWELLKSDELPESINQGLRALLVRQIYRKWASVALAKTPPAGDNQATEEQKPIVSADEAPSVDTVDTTPTPQVTAESTPAESTPAESTPAESTGDFSSTSSD